ncbi:PIN domain-containing protein [Thermococcus indicus]|nr:PIN domain-containing protein [Thermococcus indicus]
MNEKIYMDTSALIAFFNPRDRNHEAATSFFREMALEGSSFIIGRHTLLEFLSGASKRVGKRRAILIREKLLESKFIEIVAEKDGDWKDAWKCFEKYVDNNGIDVFDCLSFSIMRRLGIRKAFTFDDDFETAGFIKLP